MQTRNSLSGALAAACVLPVLLLSGCAGYKLGPTNGLAPGDKSVQVMPFVNQTYEPRLTDAVTAQVRKEIVRDGTYRLATHDDGDIVVTGSIIDFHRREVTVSRSDTLTARDFRLTLVAQVTATDRTSGRKILDQRVSGFTLIRMGNDLVSSERQALPLLAADLARNLTSRLADGTW